MAFELAAGQMASVVFGDSLSSWSAVLAAVTLGLAAGYFAGAKLATSARKATFVGAGLIFAGMLAGFPAAFADSLLPWLVRQWDYGATLIFPLLFVLPVNFFFGWISPLLIGLATHNAEKSGKNAGIFFGISTVGGIIGTFLTGFLLIPAFGVSDTLVAIACLLMLAGVLVTFRRARWWLPGMGSAGLLFLLLLPILFSASSPEFIRYRNQGLLGELVVADVPGPSGSLNRVLLNNRIGQTLYSHHTGCSVWPYVYYVSTLAAAREEKGNALLLGLAGGTVAGELQEIGYKVTAVDLDPRTYDLAREFFGLAAEVEFVTDDARHFLNTSTESYDLIVLDLFAGENQPEHVLTHEAFEKMTGLLSPTGEILINHHGIWEKDARKAQLAIARGMSAAGLQPVYYLTSGKPESRNTIFRAARKLPASVEVQFQTRCAIRLAIPKQPEIHYLSRPELETAPVHSDKHPVLGFLNRSAYKSWREVALARYVLDFSEKGAPLF